MTSPLDKLAALVAEMTEGPWTTDVFADQQLIRSANYLAVAKITPDFLDPSADLRDARGIVALRNVATALLCVAIAAEDECEILDLPDRHPLREALSRLDSAIAKEIPDDADR